MARYYTEASFIIPCDDKQANIALEALDYLVTESNFATNVFKGLIAKPNDATLDPVQKIVRHCYLGHPDLDEDSPEEELEFRFYAQNQLGKGIWIFDTESFNTEHAAIFTQAVLSAFNLPAMVSIQASHSASKPQLDAFGGHAAVVTKDFIRWHTLRDFVNAEESAHEGQERYFVCSVTEVNGELEYPNRFLMRCEGNESPLEKMKAIFLNYRGEGAFDSDEVIWYPAKGLAVKKPNYEEITPLEYAVMDKYLPTL